MEEEYIVYMRTDDAGRVTGVNSSAFLPDPTGWLAVDRGTGDRYHHAQTRYLEGPLADERGILRWKLENGRPVLRSEAERQADAAALSAARLPEVEERLFALEGAFLALMEVSGNG